MSGVHDLTITYDDGREEIRDCPCQWCDIWRATMTPDVIARLDAALREMEPAVWPEWLGPQPT